MLDSIQNPEVPFEVNQLTGVLLTTARLDREREDRYDLRVVATDGGRLPYDRRSSTATVRVTVEDVNDAVPFFFPRHYYVNMDDVTENGPAVRLIAHDNDAEGPNSELTYSWSSEVRQGLFCAFGTQLKSNYLSNSSRFFHLTQIFHPNSGQILPKSNFYTKND